MYKKFSKYFFLTFLLFLSAIVNAQEVKGKVSDTSGDLPGVNVIVKGTSKGVTTNFDGDYTLKGVKPTDVLIFSFVGYKAVEIPVAGKTVINVKLEEDSNVLDEIVVVGYGSKLKGDISGSVVSVDLGEASKTPIVNAAEALEGRVSGVSVINNGNPGSSPIVRIRGLGTVNSNNPLYIIDGVQTTDGSVLNAISPGDIEQMNVLKDGAASIYGSRASNGVIIITTKNGRYNQGKPSVSINTYTGFARVANLPSLLNAQQLGDVFVESSANSGVAFDHPQYGNGATAIVPTSLSGVINNGIDPVPSTTVNPNGTDWLDEIYQNAITQNIDFSVSNGNEASKFSFSAGYINREGSQLETSFKRGFTRLNSEFKIGKKKRIKIGEHLNVSYEKSNGGNETQRALRISPLVPVYDNNGDFAGGYNNSNGLSNVVNPVATLLRAKDNFFKRSRIIGDVYLELDIADGLKFKTTIGGEINSFNTRIFTATDPESAEPTTVSSLAEQNQNIYNWVFSSTLNYVKTFNKHNVNALLGYEALKNTGKGSEVQVNDFLFEDPDFYLLSSGSGAPVVNWAFANSSAINSVFGSLSYSYDQKYFATATVRNDQSSNFTSDNTGDIFPSFSAGWVISNEDFFPSDGIVNRLKLRGSWGQLGNQSVPVDNPTLNISRLDTNSANFPFGGSLGTGAILSEVGNANLTWETSNTSNFGFDLNMFDNKLLFSAEYFIIKTDDLIAQDLSIINDLSIDAGAPFVNAGSVENKGFDFSLGYNGETEGGFKYGITATLSAFENEVTGLNSASQLGNTIDAVGVTVNRTEVGQPIASFYGRVVDGIYRTEAEVAAGPDQGFATDADGVGRLRYVDLNDDGVINDDDRDFIGSPHPDFTYGLNLSASYKGFDLSAFITGVSGNDIYNADRVFTDFPTFYNNNRSTRVLDSFNATTNPDGNAPALSTFVANSETSANSYFIEDGSYMRLKNLQIGYSLPESAIEGIGLSQLRFYVSGSNLFTITDYTGIDPEVLPQGVDNDSDANAFTLGVDNNNTPLQQVFLLGVNIKL